MNEFEKYLHVPMKQIPPFQLVPVPLNEDARQLPGFEWAKEEIGSVTRLLDGIGFCNSGLQLSTCF